MLLYLSSYKLGNETEKLKEMSADYHNICIIPNAMDPFGDGEGRTSRLIRHKESLEELGFSAEVLDLRNYFDEEEKLRNKLKEFNGCYVLGGNCFTLISAMKRSGFDKYLLEDNDILYIGFSAGICVLGPTLKGIHLSDEPDILNYTEKPIYEGLKIVEEAFVPHYDSPEHPESKLMENVKQFLIRNNTKYMTLRDGDVIIRGFPEKKRK